jgi:hypothetical protein
LPEQLKKNKLKVLPFKLAITFKVENLWQSNQHVKPLAQAKKS